MRLRVGHQHSQFWPILVHFEQYYSSFWGARVILRIDDPRGALRVHRQHSQFWPILTRFVDYYSLFCGPGVIAMINEPLDAFRVGHQHSQFWLILVCFLDYYSLFWGPGVISTINESRGAFTCRSSTLTVLADSGPPRGLLLTILGSRSDFHDSRTAWCVYVSVMNTNNFGRFWSVSCTITRRFGVPKRFPRLVVPGVRLCVRHQH